MIMLSVDNRKITAEEGKTVLEACLENGVYIPNLCFLKEMQNPPASCRLCFVHINGEDRPVSSCKVTVQEGMVVRTDTEAVRRLQRAGLRLLLSVHEAACRSCPANRHCPLQDMAKFLKVRLKPRRLEHIRREPVEGPPHPWLEYNPSRCVLCGKCVYICRKRNGLALLTFAGRGFDTVISSFDGMGPEQLSCDRCGACMEVCPVAAIRFKDDAEKSGLYA